jgi:hypothetical protein
MNYTHTWKKEKYFLSELVVDGEERKEHIFSHVQWTHNLRITLTSFLLKYAKDDAMTDLSGFLRTKMLIT